MTGLFQFTCRLFAETEARFTSVERLISYGSGLELEGNDHAEEEVSPQWPKAGQITFENVKVCLVDSLILINLVEKHPRKHSVQAL